MQPSTGRQVWFIRLILIAAILTAAGTVVSGQDANPPPRGVMIPDPTPRPPDLQKQFGEDPADVKRRQQAQLIQNQLRAREVWLEANQLLLLAQQLQAEMVQRNKGDSLLAGASKAAAIEKLAKSVKDKSKSH